MRNKEDRLRISDGVRPLSSGEHHPATLTKRCGKCKQLKDRNKFYADKSKRDGKMSTCKSCQAERKRLRRGTQELIDTVVEASESVGGTVEVVPVEGKPADLSGLQAYANADTAIYDGAYDNLMKSIRDSKDACARKSPLKFDGSSIRGDGSLSEFNAKVARNVDDIKKIEQLKKELSDAMANNGELSSKLDDANSIIAEQDGNKERVVEQDERIAELEEQNAFMLKGAAGCGDSAEYPEIELTLYRVLGMLVLERPASEIVSVIKAELL